MFTTVMSNNNGIRYDKSTSIGMLTGSIFGLLKRELQHQFDAREVPIRVELFPIINRLFIQDAVPQQTIAEWFGYDRPKTSRVLDELENAGLVQRTDDPESRRTKLICLSSFSKEIRPIIIDALEETFEIAYKGFTKKDIDDLIKKLQTVKLNLEP
ncbi:MarR family winged helix-turn-helix transcriptional regulator [Ulvibacterium sp.]|uniref:MarR family winged helix-turn-helix transcriptional regulator n=1 Tax=Ulvibacterium sp. TaxID=2665914 RepID=UPI003BACEACB